MHCCGRHWFSWACRRFVVVLVGGLVLGQSGRGSIPCVLAGDERFLVDPRVRLGVLPTAFRPF